MPFLFTDKSQFTAYYSGGFLKRATSFLDYKKLKGFSQMRNLMLLLSLKLNLVKTEEDENALHFLNRKKISKDAIKNFWTPFCVSALNTPIESTSASLMLATIKKSILSGGLNGVLYLPQRPISDALENAEIFLESCGSKVYRAEIVKEIFSKNGKVFAVKTNKCDMAACNHIILALPPESVKTLLPSDSSLVKNIEQMRHTEILNVYFTCAKKLGNTKYACLNGTELHWIFDYTERFRNASKNSDLHMYGVTVSASNIEMKKDEIKNLLEDRLSKYFGDFQIEEILPLRFAHATISADAKTDSLRPSANSTGFENLTLAGDWIATGLPATLEGAALSGNIDL